MKPEEKSGADVGHDHLLHQLLALPKRIIQMHGVSALPEMVLHELCHDHCFNINKAVYLVDNPDFDCLQGVAGYVREECCHHKDDLWKDPHTFEEDMQNAPYRQEIKGFADHSLCAHKQREYSQKELEELGNRLGIKHPLCFTWGTKHDNHGILIVEDDSRCESEKKKLLYNVISLLSIC